MELSSQQQILDQLVKSQRVLIALPENLSPDTVSSAFAFRLFLQKLEKEADIVTSGKISETLHFLPGSHAVLHDFSMAKTFVISVDTSIKKLEEISYQAVDQKLNIYVKPKTGQFTSEDVSFASDQFHYDVIVVLGCATLEDLGAVFEHYADIFFESPKINIDTNPANEFFGAINLVDINSVSISEILSELFSSFEQQLIDEDIATCLLAGIITKTNSFQHIQTTPQAFLKASQLITLGGRQQEVIQFLYKTKSLPLLRLWGRALARLKIHDELSSVYSMLNLSDFGKAGAGDENLHDVLQELLDNISDYKTVGLISETLGGGVCFQIAVHKSLDAEKLARSFGPEGKVSGYVSGSFATVEATMKGLSLQDAESKYLTAIAELKS